MFNILTDKLIRMDISADSRVEASLPEVYAALMADEVESFPALRPHQRHALHACLSQLGAMAMHRADMTEPPMDAAEWADIIRGLTPDFLDDEPWHLVVDDIIKPAFMQPPASSVEKLSEYLYKSKKGRYEPANGKKPLLRTPDELDMLVTSRNHDLKSTIVVEPSVDDWIFSLIALQTDSAQDGVGNYSVSRIRSAYSARPAISIAPASKQGTVRWGGHVRRDIDALTEHREDFADNGVTTDDGLTLLWVRPWDGTAREALLLGQLDHFYIDICRRVRLCIRGETIVGVRATSKSPRVSKTNQGRANDPWIPVDDDNLALNVGPAGLTYNRLTDYLSSWDWPMLLEPTPSEQSSGLPTFLVARSLKRNTRKQGMTEGYGERIIQLIPEATAQSDGLKKLGDIAKDRVEQIGIVQRILSHAIQTFIAGGDSGKSTSEHRNRARKWLNGLDEIVDRTFFDHLQAEFKASDADERDRIRKAWLMGVVNDARILLQDATDSLPCPAIHRYKARFNAEGLFVRRLRSNKGLPDIFK